MRRWVAPAALLAAAAGVLVWWAPWNSPPSAVAGARAAFGSRPIVHVVARTGGALDTTAVQTVIGETQWEIWWDPSRRLAHVVSRKRSKVVVDALGLHGDPLPIQTVLGLFVTRYGPELAAGRMRPAGSGTVQDRRVLWLRSPDLVIAIDPVSHEALWVERAAARVPINRLVQIVRAETLPAGAGDFEIQAKKKPRHL